VFSARASAGRLYGIDVTRVVKKLVDRAGLDNTKYAGHSLRAGHHPPRLVRGQSILQRPFGSGVQKRRLAGVDRAWW